MTWGATKKEVERSNFFKEVPKIMKRCGNFVCLIGPCVLSCTSLSSIRFWFSVLLAVLSLGGIVILATPLVPLGWRVDGSAWAVIFPLA